MLKKNIYTHFILQMAITCGLNLTRLQLFPYLSKDIKGEISNLKGYQRKEKQGSIANMEVCHNQEAQLCAPTAVVKAIIRRFVHIQ